MAGLSAEECRLGSGDHHLVIVCEPHKALPVMVWLGPVLVAQLPSRDVLSVLLEEHVLQRLRHRMLPLLMSAPAVARR